MAHRYQFVNALLDPSDPNFEVLLDLDDGQPFWISEGTNVSPAPMRRSAVAGLGDGDIETDSTFGNRTVRLVLDVEEVAATVQAAAISKLVNILNRPDGAWLMWQSENLSEPVFFRTWRASPEVIDRIVDETPDRDVTITLDAAPFGHGLEVTHTFTVANDPTATTNPMGYAFGPILGDVPTPAHVTFDIPDDDLATYWASRAVIVGQAAPDAPYFLPFKDMTADSEMPDGWSFSEVSDPTSVSGTVWYLTQDAAEVSTVNPLAGIETWPGLPAGEYRLFVRAQPDVSSQYDGTEFRFFNRVPPGGALSYDEGDAAASVTLHQDDNVGKAEWFELGVVAMPAGAPLEDPVFGLTPTLGEALVAFQVANTLGDDTLGIKLDGLLALPSGRPGEIVRQGSASFDEFFTDRAVTIDGITSQWTATGLNTMTGAVRSPVRPQALTAGEPLLVPRAVSNTLYFMVSTSTQRGVTDVNVNRAEDDKTTETVVTVTYHPLYAYARADTE